MYTAVSSMPLKKCLILCYVNFTAKKKKPQSLAFWVLFMSMASGFGVGPMGSGVPERPSSLRTSKAVPRVSREGKILHHEKQVISKWTQLTL